MKEPRPSVTSARPPEAAFSVEKRSNTRIGSSEDRTVTAEPSLMRLVRPAIAASTTSGAETEKSGRWCSPTPKASMPSSSASTPSSTTSRMTCAWVKSLPLDAMVTSPKVSSPNSKFCAIFVCLQVYCRRSKALKPRRTVRAHLGGGTNMGIHPTRSKRTPMIPSAVALILRREGWEGTRQVTGLWRRPVFGRCDPQTGSVLPASLCDLPICTFSLIRKHRHGQIGHSWVTSDKKQSAFARNGAANQRG
jgi:hypothetical protein